MDRSACPPIIGAWTKRPPRCFASRRENRTRRLSRCGCGMSSSWSGTGCRSSSYAPRFATCWSMTTCGRSPARSTNQSWATAKLQNVFGCGDSSFERALAFAPEAVSAAYAPGADRLRHADELNRDVLDRLYDLRLRARRVMLGGIGIFGALGPLAAWLGGSGAGGGHQPREERIGRL